MEKTKILLAEDEETVLEIMGERIAADGYEVILAKDGAEAWEKIQTENPDVIILDLTMPKKHGFEVLKDLREHPLSSKWQPVIIVSAHAELDDMKKGYALEADHYITKPCRAEDILKAIRLMIKLIPQRET